MEQGESLEGMQDFMDTREKIKSTRYRLSKLPELPGESTIDEQVQITGNLVPVRQTRRLQGGETTTHGFYTHKKDMQAVREVMAEDIQGMEQETACLRKLMRGLLEREGDEMRLVEAVFTGCPEAGVAHHGKRTEGEGEGRPLGRGVLELFG